MAGSYWDRSLGGVGEGLPMVTRKLGLASPTAGESPARASWLRGESTRALDELAEQMASDQARMLAFDRAHQGEKFAAEQEQRTLANQAKDPAWQRINAVRDLQHNAGTLNNPLRYDTVRREAREKEDLADIAAQRGGQRFFDPDVTAQREATWGQGLRESRARYTDPALIRAQAELDIRRMQNQGDVMAAREKSAGDLDRASMQALGNVTESLIGEGGKFDPKVAGSAYDFLERGRRTLTGEAPETVDYQWVAQEAAKQGVPVETALRMLEDKGIEVRYPPQ